MLVIERQREIMQRVNREGSARVSELARMFEVTKETIRRDLDQLESAGRLQRSHGGAVNIKPDDRDIPIAEREMRHVAEKTLIAREAVRRVVAGDTIFIDSSTTALQFARNLPDINLTVLTNAIKVAVELSSRPHIRVISTGGLLSTPTLSFVGPTAERIVDEYHVNKLFISCKGVDLERGISESNELQAGLKRHLLANSDIRYLLVDSAKFDVRGLSIFARISDISELITDKSANGTFVAALQQQGLKVCTA
jgi:DeoR/GlpR family transcriptional regulator of sugar metabolism